ncbi:MAG: response regulator receiver domain protein [Tardiphaga sp.]|jgi:two-component system chemotaxis response regulator CheY|nr:response regulator receiver domain protein [Tardiphaga sp.]
MVAPKAPRHRIVDGIVRRLPLLIIDDDRLQRALIKGAAEKCGFCVTQAASCQEALAHLKSESFVCVTLDLKLADGDGIDIINAMADLKYAGQVIVISGMAAAQRIAARQLGRSRGIMPSLSLPKPIDLAALRIAFAQLRSQISGLPIVHGWGEAPGHAVESSMR